MPYWTCKKCGKIYCYAKNDKPPKCTCRKTKTFTKAVQGKIERLGETKEKTDEKYFKKAGIEGEKSIFD